MATKSTDRVYTTAELAKEMSTTPYLLRRKLRAKGIKVGSGKRHTWTKAQFARVKKQITS